MSDRVKKVSYAYVMVPDRAGRGPMFWPQLRRAKSGSDRAFSAFPGRGGKAQVDLISRRFPRPRGIARRNGWRLSKVEEGIRGSGDDRVGAVSRHLDSSTARRSMWLPPTP